MAPNTFVIGLQWGDEGKGKIVDALAPAYALVARAQGGANAGHTVVLKGKRFPLHLLPAGVLHPGKECVVGNGVAFDPEVFLSEVDWIEKQGIRVRGRLFVSDRAHLVFPYHRELDRIWEEESGASRIGTTRKGIGPCYADKAMRTTAVRTGELLSPGAFRTRLAGIAGRQRRRGAEVDLARLTERMLGFGLRLRPFIRDTVTLLHDRWRRGRRMLFEGAHGAMLDLDFGTYPYVTSSSTCAGGVCSGLGLPPKAVGEVLAVVKAYTTRVGEGPLPTELKGRLGEELRKLGGEFGTTTGRPRRCGWLDAVQLRYAARVNGVDALAVTKLDVLDRQEEILVCTSYRLGNRTVREYPADAGVLARVRPVYERWRGWCRPTGGVRRMSDLPREARAYVARIGELCGAPVRMISVGAERAAVAR